MVELDVQVVAPTVEEDPETQLVHVVEDADEL